MTTSEVPKNESNVIPLLPAEVREPLEAFTRTLSLSDFLDALKAIAPLKVPIDPLIKTWEAHLYKFAEKLPKRGTSFYQNYREERKQFEIDIAPFTAIIDWLAQFELDPELRKNETESDESEGVLSENTPDKPDDIEELDKLAGDISRASIECDKQRRHLEEIYPCFPAAWPLESVLPKYFGDDDPGAFIAQFLAMFYQVQEQEHEPGRHEGGNWAAGLKFKLITIRNPGWREFVEENLIESLFALETMHWLNDINVTDNQASCLIKELADIHAAIEGKLNVVDASALPGQMLVQRYVLKHIFWMRQVREAKKAEEKNASEEGEIDAVEDDVEVAEEDEETAESNRNLAKIQGLADALPLVKGIVFGGAEMGHYLPGPFSDEFKFSDAPRLLPLLPQAMFERVVYWANESREQLYDIDQFFYSGIAAFLDVILLWPMAEEALFWDDFDNPAFRGKIGGEAIQDIVPFGKMPHMTIYLLGRLFSTLFWLGPGIIVEAARQSNGNVFSPPEFSIQRLGYLIERAIERIAHARRIAHAGLSPVSIDSAAEIGFCLSEICPLLKLAPKHDLSYLLAAPPDWADDFGSFAGDVNKQDTSEETQRYAQDRAANYMRVFHAAVEEGWDEFANAVLAFFLFSQPIHFENRLYVDWRDLGAALRLAPTLKGYHRIERALGIAGKLICGDGQRHYDALYRSEAYAICL